MAEGLLNLRRWLTRDTYRLILRRLTHIDRDMCLAAHGVHIEWGRLPMADYCARHGYLSLLIWIGRIPPHEGRIVYDLAAQHGHLNMVIWASKQYDITTKTSFLPSIAFESAARGGHVHVLEWLYAQGCRPHTPVYYGAASVGRVDVLEWLVMRDSDFKPKSLICEGAAYGGSITALKWAIAYGCPITSEVVCTAALAGHVNVLQMIWDPDPDYHGRLILPFINAIRGGKLEVLQWLYTRHHADIPSTYLCASAAQYGQLHILQWLRAIGCAWDVKVIVFAHDNGHYEVAQWARENGCPEYE
jgi:hypothetical protein